MFDHRDGEARILRGPLAEPLQRPPALVGRQILAFESGREHVREPAFFPPAVDAEVRVEPPVVLKQPRDRVERLVAHHALGRLHRGNLVLRRDRRGIGNARRQFQHIHAQEMLIVHAGPQAIAIGLGRRVAAEVLKRAEQPRVRIEAGGRLLIFRAAATDQRLAASPGCTRTGRRGF